MPSKDQRSIEGGETTHEKWDRARSLFMESLYKPDHELRACAHNQKCYYELLAIRDSMVEYVKSMKNPHTTDTSSYNNIPTRY